MRFMNLTICNLLLHFQYPWALVRYLAFILNPNKSWSVILLLPLLILGFLFYVTGLGISLYLLRAKQTIQKDWLLWGLEKLRLEPSFDSLKQIKEAFRKEDIPFSIFTEEQKKLGIFVELV